MWSWHDGPDGWGVFWMGLMMALVWLPILLILIWAMRDFGRSGREDDSSRRSLPPAPDALEIARRAYAKGELDRERYLEIIEDLERTKG